jgi:8-oxo-dGTP diphosphatase
MSNPYFFPVPTVRMIIPNSQGQVLLLQRAATDYAGGLWCLPGGKVNYHETVEDSIKRELYEETMLTCIDCKFLFYQDSLPMKPRGMHCLNLYFECAWSGDVQLNEESDSFVWLDEQAIDQYNITFKNDLALKEYWILKPRFGKS